MSFGLRSRKSRRRFGKRTDMDRKAGKSSFGDRIKTAVRKANKTANKAADHAAKAGNIAKIAGDVSGSDRLSAGGAALLGPISGKNHPELKTATSMRAASFPAF